MKIDHALRAEITALVARALAEDVGAGDVTAELIDESELTGATIVTREAMTMAGRPWVHEVLKQVDSTVTIEWHRDDGDRVEPEQVICTLRGSARSILTAERTALNFLQTLSATATATARYVQAVAGTECKILDTRKTIPGLRRAQKYAVTCGGGVNHRVGLFDAILIKENHIRSAGGITAAVDSARKTHDGLPIEIEVETLEELREALAAKVERVLLDNMPLAEFSQAVAINRAEGDPPAKLEASGGMTLDEVADVAATGVDYISVGALTKNIQAIDLSMRFD